ncbi:MAG TPA: SpoIIE family protein phosphatase [Bryobacteraceae bacterium]|nr:SpoIIE family protein phosphatase [Bryobacteraceae bacterium]
MQRPYTIKRTPARGLYVLFCLYMAVSFSYQIVASVSLITGYFDLRHQVQTPFEPDYLRPVVNSVSDEAKRAGLRTGDIIVSLNGQPYRGRALWQRERWYARPGDTWRIGVRRPDGTQGSVAVSLKAFPQSATANSALNGASLGEAVFIVFMQIVVPLFCLGLGYWVALARPADPNAWFILFLLSYPEAFISVSTFNWWPGIWFLLRLNWHISLEVLAPAALLFLGLFFPERSRIDTRFPWFKWLVLIVLLGSLCVALTIDYVAWYHFGLIANAAAIDQINDKVVDWTIVVCIAVYWIAIFDKLRTASTPDSQRRLRVLCAGSVAGLGSVLFIFGALPLFGVADPSSIQWLGYLSAVLMLAFPLSLAYVVVVQRAMDVRILLRMGTKYALARGTVWILRTTLLVLTGIFFWQTARAPHINAAAVVRLIILATLVLLVSPRVFEPISRWIDRRFFREAYNADLVLSELSEQVRHFTETVPLIETVSQRISDVLHISQVSVLLRDRDGFRLCHSVNPAQVLTLRLPEQSTVVQRVVEGNRPAVLYEQSAEEWLVEAKPQERQTLQELQAEVLLALPGRERLMGVMALGPKRSEAPYSLSDLRVLQSVGVQTGLALEVSELVRSLAQEASQRARMNREIEIARDVQQRFFPQRMPAVQGLDLAGACRPALGVGGDYYDVIDLGDGRVGLAIGDVSGKGISAALLMASLRACLRTITLVTQSAHSSGQRQPANLASLMQDMNRLVYESSEINRYATFFFGIYDPGDRAFHYVNAGHNPPVLLRTTGNGAVRRLDVGGPVIGLVTGVAYRSDVLTFEKGDLLLAYTDGISEAMTVDDEEWGEERMLAAAERLRHGSAGDVLRGIFTDADQFTGGAPQHDDMTLLVLKVG